MSSSHLAKVAGDLARVMVRDPELHNQLSDAFLLLTESLAMVSDSGAASVAVAEQVIPGLSINARRVAALVRALRDREPGERMSIALTRTGWSKATYFRALKEAKQAGLV